MSVESVMWEDSRWHAAPAGPKRSPAVTSAWSGARRLRRATAGESESTREEEGLLVEACMGWTRGVHLHCCVRPLR